MKKLLLFIFLSNYSFAQQQNKYPAKLFIYPDTICAISLPQLKAINISFIKLDECAETSDTLRSILKHQKDAIIGQASLIKGYKKQLDLKSTIIDSQNSMIVDLKLLDKKNVKKIKWLRLQRNTLAIVSIILIAKVFLFQH